MGRGNIAPRDRCVGLFYVDYDNILEYQCHTLDVDDHMALNNPECMSCDITHWEIDEELSNLNYETFIEMFKADFMKRFSSFECAYGHNNDVYRDQTAILENKLFTIVTEDNEWSVAIQLLQKEDIPTGLASRLTQTYLDGIKFCLFNQFATLGIYAGPWTHGTITRPVA